MKTASAIICVFNEEKTLREVIKSVSKDSCINEIIVVNDGSTDNSKNIIKELKQEIALIDIHFAANKGKGYAMAVGVENSMGEIIVFIDADQTEIVPGYIGQLIRPLLEDETDMVLGYTTVNLLRQEVNPLKILAGERALRKKDVSPILDKIKESRFGVETLLYFYFNAMGKTIKFIRLAGLSHKDKYEKMSFAQATRSYLNEGWEIASTTLKNHDLVLKTFQNSIKKECKNIKRELVAKKALIEYQAKER